MNTITRPAFVVQENGAICVSNGTANAIFGSIAHFNAAEPDFTLPTGLSAITYEQINGVWVFLGLSTTGTVVKASAADPQTGIRTLAVGENPGITDEELLGYIALTATYAQLLTDMKHPFYGVTELPEALAVGTKELSDELSRRMLALVEGIYGDLERETWRLQQDEAEAWDADNNALTPYLDGIRIAGETKSDQVATILSRVAQYETATAALLKRKRELLAELYTLQNVAAVVNWYNMNMKSYWPVL